MFRCRFEHRSSFPQKHNNVETCHLALYAHISRTKCRYGLELSFLSIVLFPICSQLARVLQTYQIYNLRLDFGIIEQRRWRQMRLKLLYPKRRTTGCRTGTHCFLNRVQILQVPIQKLCNIDLQVYRVDVPINSKKRFASKKHVCVFHLCNLSVF